MENIINRIIELENALSDLKCKNRNVIEQNAQLQLLHNSNDTYKKQSEANEKEIKVLIKKIGELSSELNQSKLYANLLESKIIDLMNLPSEQCNINHFISVEENLKNHLLKLKNDYENLKKRHEEEKEAIIRCGKRRVEEITLETSRVISQKNFELENFKLMHKNYENTLTEKENKIQKLISNQMQLAKDTADKEFIIGQLKGQLTSQSAYQSAFENKFEQISEEIENLRDNRKEQENFAKNLYISEINTIKDTFNEMNTYKLELEEKLRILAKNEAKEIYTIMADKKKNADIEDKNKNLMQELEEANKRYNEMKLQHDNLQIEYQKLNEKTKNIESSYKQLFDSKNAQTNSSKMGNNLTEVHDENSIINNQYDSLKREIDALKNSNALMRKKLNTKADTIPLNLKNQIIKLIESSIKIHLAIKIFYNDI